MRRPEVNMFTGLELVTVTQTEYDRQTAIVEQLRAEQHIALLRSGVAQRVVGSNGLANMLTAPTASLNEGSNVYLTQAALGGLSSMASAGLVAETGLQRASLDTVVYRLGRHDTRGAADGIKTISCWTYFAGSALVSPSGALEDIRPIEGVTEEDIVFAHGLLVAMQEKRMRHRLTILDSRRLCSAIVSIVE